MINPLLCIQEGRISYKCCIGNNRYLAAHELGIKEVPIKIITSEVPERPMMAATMKIIFPQKLKVYPPRAREYEARKIKMNFDSGYSSGQSILKYS